MRFGKLFVGACTAALALTGLCLSSTAQANVPQLYTSYYVHYDFTFDFNGDHRNPYNYEDSDTGFDGHWYKLTHPATLTITSQTNVDATDATFTGVLNDSGTFYAVSGKLSQPSLLFDIGGGTYISFDATTSGSSEHYDGVLMVHNGSAYLAGSRSWYHHSGFFFGGGITPFCGDGYQTSPPPP